MRLYVCYGTFNLRRHGGHPCRNAHQALLAAGHRPEVLKTYGCVGDPLFPGRREVKRLTGNHEVPTLVLDDGTVIDGSAEIITWASQAHAQTGEVGSPSSISG
jgi:glutathione S-transferase